MLRRTAKFSYSTVHVALMIVTFIATSCIQMGQEPRTFDAQIWAKHLYDQSAHNPRRAMADDLRRKQLLNNMSRTEVLKILGPPINSPATGGNEAKELLFNLGTEPTGESVLLGVVFRDDRVSDVIIHTW